VTRASVYEDRDGFAFTATTVTMASCVAAIFVDLYPNVMVSSTSSAYNLTVHNAASGNYSLKAMTVVVIVFLPLVLAYQAWTYYVFRKRVSASDFRRPRRHREPRGSRRQSQGHSPPPPGGPGELSRIARCGGWPPGRGTIR